MKITKQIGFTLLELLISLALSAIVLVILVGSFYQLSQNWQKQNNALDEQIDDALMLVEIERALSGAVAFSYRDEESAKKKTFFTGTEDTLQWTSSSSPSYNDRITIWSVKVLEQGIKLLVTPVLKGDPQQQIDYAKKNIPESSMTLFENYQLNLHYLSESVDHKMQWLNKVPVENNNNFPRAIWLEFSGQRQNDDLPAFDLLVAIKSAKNHYNQSRRTH